MTEPALNTGNHGGQETARHALSSGELELPAKFRFNCYDTRFDTVVVANGDDRAKLAVQGHLGTLPYTAESTLARQYISSVVNVSDDLPYAEISLSHKQEIIIHASMDFPGHPTPETVIAATTAITVAVKPFIDMISMLRMAGRSTA